jgi:hypothetical protein
MVDEPATVEEALMPMSACWTLPSLISAFAILTA